MAIQLRHSESGIRLEIDNQPEYVFISEAQLRESVIVGRYDPATGTLPDIDLTRLVDFDTGISRRHAELAMPKNGIVTVTDLGSTNGIFVNGKKLRPDMPELLVSGDVLRLGDLLVVVQFALVH
jgi:pSer/pThr/pTyr-binding forkhead associated (FHA) protein